MVYLSEDKKQQLIQSIILFSKKAYYNQAT